LIYSLSHCTYTTFPPYIMGESSPRLLHCNYFAQCSWLEYSLISGVSCLLAPACLLAAFSCGSCQPPLCYTRIHGAKILFYIFIATSKVTWSAMCLASGNQYVHFTKQTFILKTRSNVNITSFLSYDTKL
jgi:hypothetical protein